MSTEHARRKEEHIKANHRAFVDVLDRLEARNQKLRAKSDRLGDIGASWEYTGGDEKTEHFLYFFEDWNEEVPQLLRAGTAYRSFPAFRNAQWNRGRHPDPATLKEDMNYFLRKTCYSDDYPDC
jgi:hypothetical protein